MSKYNDQATIATARAFRFAATSCSQCGASLGPGDSGVSSCQDHGVAPVMRGEHDDPTPRQRRANLMHDLVSLSNQLQAIHSEAADAGCGDVAVMLTEMGFKAGSMIRNVGRKRDETTNQASDAA